MLNCIQHALRSIFYFITLTMLLSSVPTAALAAQNGSPFQTAEQKSPTLQSSAVLQSALADSPALSIKLPSPSDIVLKDGVLLFSAQLSNSRSYPVGAIRISAVLAQGQLLPMTITDETNGRTHVQQQYQAVPALGYDLPVTYAFKANENRNLQFQVPVSIFLPKGSYDLQVVAKEQHGIVIGKSSVSLPISLGQASGTLSIKKDSAKLDSLNGQPLLADQPLVALGGILSFHAVLINSSALPLAAVPVLKIIPQNSVEGTSGLSVIEQPSVTVAERAERSVTYSVPAQKLPGTYAVSLVLTDQATSAALSYPAIRYYVVQGPSASTAYQKFAVTGQRILNSKIEGTVYVVGSADNKSEFVGTLVTTVLLVGTNNVLSRQSQPVSINAGAPLTTLNVHLAYNKPLSGIGDITVRTELLDPAGNVLDSLQSAYFPIYSSRNILLILICGLIGLLLLTALLLALRKLKRRQFAPNTVLASFAIAAALVGLMVSPVNINAHPNINNQQERHNDGLKWTLNNTGNGIGSQAIGGSSINGDQYTSYIAGANGGVAVATLTVSPGWGNGWSHNYSGTATTTNISCNATYYMDGDRFFYSQYPTNASNIQSFYDICKYAAPSGRSFQITCPNGKLTPDFYDASCWLTGMHSQTLPLVNGGNIPVALYGIPLPNGGYDYNGGNTENTWEEAPRQFWFPNITPIVEGDLIACSADDAFKNRLGGAAGFGSITNSESPYSFKIDPFGNTTVWAATTHTQNGSFIYSVAACTGIQPGSYVGRTQIDFKMTENSYFYVGSPNGGNGRHGDSNYISNNYVATLIRIWGNHTRPSNMGGDKDLYDFASHLYDSSWSNPSWSEYSPHIAAEAVIHENRDKTSADNSGFDTSQNWNVYVPANNPEMNIYDVCQRFAFYSYNPGNLLSANPNNAFFQGNQGLVKPAPTESANTYNTSYQNNCSPQPAPYPSAPFDYSLTVAPNPVPNAGTYTLTYAPNPSSTKATQVVFYCSPTDSAHSVNVDPSSNGTAQYIGCSNTNNSVAAITVMAGAKGFASGVMQPTSNLGVILLGTGPSTLNAILTIDPTSIPLGSHFKLSLVATDALSSYITRTDGGGTTVDTCVPADFTMTGGVCSDTPTAAGIYTYTGYACPTATRVGCASNSVIASAGPTAGPTAGASGGELLITANTTPGQVAPGEQFTITARRNSASTASGQVRYTFICGNYSSLTAGSTSPQDKTSTQNATVSCTADTGISTPTDIHWQVIATEGSETSLPSKGVVKVVPQIIPAIVGISSNYFCSGD